MVKTVQREFLRVKCSLNSIELVRLKKVCRQKARRRKCQPGKGSRQIGARSQKLLHRHISRDLFARKRGIHRHGLLLSELTLIFNLSFVWLVSSKLRSFDWPVGSYSWKVDRREEAKEGTHLGRRDDQEVGKSTHASADCHERKENHPQWHQACVSLFRLKACCKLNNLDRRSLFQKHLGHRRQLDSSCWHRRGSKSGQKQHAD